MIVVVSTHSVAIIEQSQRSALNNAFVNVAGLIETCSVVAMSDWPVYV